MAPRPSSPTSLLWAHQLKREHGYLLQRMQNLETKSEDQDSRLLAAESSTASSTSPELGALAEQVKALNGAGVEKRITDMEKNVAEKLENVQAESEAHTIQIASLQDNAQTAENEKRKSIGKDKMLLKRIEEIEAQLQQYEKGLGRIGKRPDETRFERIKGQLNVLTKEAQRDGEQMKWLQESITALELANAELLKANEKLDRDLARQAAKQANGGQKRSAQDAQATAGAEDEDSARKNKSHKWVGGGADRDIIRTGSGLFKKPSKGPNSAQTTSTKAPVQTSPTKNTTIVGRKKKPQPEALKPQRFIPNDSTDTPKKSHRWAGGGADKDIIEAGVSVGGKRRRPGDDVVEVANKKRQRWSEGDADADTIHASSSSTSKVQSSNLGKIKYDAPKPSRRSIPQAEGDEVVVGGGKGWIVVVEEEVEGEEEEVAPPPVKRKRGRPRKDAAAPQVVEEVAEEDPPEARKRRRSKEKSPEPIYGGPLADKILGDLKLVSAAQELLFVEPSMSRAKLERLKNLFERNPKARHDLDILARESMKDEPAKKKRAGDVAFGSDDDEEVANRERIKRIKREEAPESSTAEGLYSIPRVYRSQSISPVDGTIGGEGAQSAASHPPRKSRRSIIQSDDEKAS